MKLRLIPIIALTLISIHAADDPRLAAVRAADDERVAAVIAGDQARLTAILSDELHYAHSNGGIDTKAKFIDNLTSGRTKYLTIDSEVRNFTFPAPGIALMSGRIRMQVKGAAGTMDSMMSYLAVWREENGKWRFLAWQSCKIPPPAPPKP